MPDNGVIKMGNGGWKVDKTISLPLLFALAVQTAGALWWASGINSDVSNLKLNLAEVKGSVDFLEKANEQVVRNQVKLENVEKALARQEDWFRRLKDSVDTFMRDNNKK